MLKRYPLERYYRDARAAAVMRPWTQDITTQQAWERPCALRLQANQAWRRATEASGNGCLRAGEKVC